MVSSLITLINASGYFLCILNCLSIKIDCKGTISDYILFFYEYKNRLQSNI